MKKSITTTLRHEEGKEYTVLAKPIPAGQDKITWHTEFDSNMFSASNTEETIVLDEALTRDSTFWNSQRHERLTEKEQNIYAMVDSVKEVPIFHTITNTINMFITGYWAHSWWEFGPYLMFFYSAGAANAAPAIFLGLTITILGKIKANNCVTIKM